MKKLIVIAAALILSTSVVFAQNAAPQNAVINKKSSAHPANGPCRYCPLDKGMMMHGMMMRMVNASMVATSDGGVIVL
ncbi:MAG: hypothetical protein KGJ11_06940, partial [Candidatus Omnitrophica bacterium]|nr:hypothetical protein [Candidatus Omnitrophota bacterium]